MARAQPGSTRRYLQPRATQLRRNSSSHAAPAQVRGMVHSCIGKTPAPAAAATPVADVAGSARLNDLLRNLGTSGPPSLSSRSEGEWLDIYFICRRAPLSLTTPTGSTGGAKKSTHSITSLMRSRVPLFSLFYCSQ